MGGRFSAVFALALVALAGCASTGSKVRGGPGSTVQLVVPEAVAWEPGDDFIVPVTVFNATKMMLQIAQPGDDSVEFTLYKPDGSRACGSPRVTWHQVEPFRIQRVRPLTGMPYKAKFDAYCQDLASGVYRYDISYHASSPSDSFTDAVWTGQLGPLSGRVLLRSGARGLKYEELLAAFEAKEGSPEATAAGAARRSAVRSEIIAGVSPWAGESRRLAPALARGVPSASPGIPGRFARAPHGVGDRAGNGGTAPLTVPATLASLGAPGVTPPRRLRSR